MRFFRVLQAALPGKLGVAVTLITVLAAAPLAAFVMAHGEGGGSTASGHYSGVPSPTAGAGLPVIALGIGAYWLVGRRRSKSETGFPRGDLKD